MIKIEGLGFSYNQNSQNNIKVFENFNLQIDSKKFTAIIGSNGSGKSTLAKLLNALLIPSAGKIFIKGFDTSKKENLLAIRRNQGFVFQNPETQLFNSLVYEELSFALENLNFAPKEIQKNVLETAKLCNIENLLEKEITSLSTSEKQKLCVACAISTMPELLILDEPTAFLNEEESIKFMKLLEKIHTERKTGIILITHKKYEAAYASEKINLKNGYLSDSFEYFPENPKSSFCDFNELFQNQRNINLDSAKPKKFFSSCQELPLLEVKNINYSNSKKEIFKDFSLKIQAGDTIFLKGKSGSGKSILCKILKNLENPDSGKIFYKGHNIYERKFKNIDFQKKVALCFQNSDQNLFSDTVLKDVSYGLKNLGFPEQLALEKAKNILTELDFPKNLFNSSPNCLSGGQKKLVSLAGLLVMNPELLLLDNADAGLDYYFVEKIAKYISQMQKKTKMACLIISG